MDLHRDLYRNQDMGAWAQARSRQRWVTVDGGMGKLLTMRCRPQTSPPLFLGLGVTTACSRLGASWGSAGS
jgi:hypothetical protein